MGRNGGGQCHRRGRHGIFHDHHPPKKNENVFHLIIDRQRTEENVYFLNAVTEKDLLTLAEPEPEPEKDAGFPIGNLLMIAVVLLVGGGAAYYF